MRVFDQQDGRERLRNAILDEVIQRKQGGLSDEELRITVTAFRLRSTAAALWAAFAGADMLDVSVTVVRGNQIVRSFSTGAGTLAGGIIKPGPSGRFNGLVKRVAERVVAQL